MKQFCSNNILTYNAAGDSDCIMYIYYVRLCEILEQLRKIEGSVDLSSLVILVLFRGMCCYFLILKDKK